MAQCDYGPQAGLVLHTFRDWRDLYVIAINSPSVIHSCQD
jgi:hypothetical protein